LLVSDKVVADCPPTIPLFPNTRTPIPSLDPDVADLAPSLTGYDEQHAITYMRLLDADAEGADWREVARIVLHIDPDREPDRARQIFERLSCPCQMRASHGYGWPR